MPLPESEIAVPVGARRDRAYDSGRLRSAGREPIEVDAETPAFRAGDRVIHERFGTGLVVSCEIVPGDQQVTVAVEGQGVKRLLLSFAPLRRGDDAAGSRAVGLADAESFENG